MTGIINNMAQKGIVTIDSEEELGQIGNISITLKKESTNEPNSMPHDRLVETSDKSLYTNNDAKKIKRFRE